MGGRLEMLLQPNKTPLGILAYKKGSNRKEHHPNTTEKDYNQHKKERKLVEA
jgi:hypothetical protein